MEAVMNKKRGGPSLPSRHSKVVPYGEAKMHRVKLEDHDPSVFEAVIIFIALVGVLGGAYGLYTLSQVS
jgi:hypothetical protein